MIEDLRWLGIEWTEGPDCGRAVRSVRAERAAAALSGRVEDAAGSRDDLSVYLLAEGCGAGCGGAE